MAKVYTLASDALYNGARDSEGGIWVRMKDEDDRRILAQAVDKQLKNQEASKGTLSALDPNASHLVDYIRWALERVKEGINGARPPENQLDGTPMGDATNGDEPAAKPARGKRGGKPSTVGEVLKTVAGGPLPGSPPAAGAGIDGDDGIQWADSVPVPRPANGDRVHAADGAESRITKVVGYDGEAGAFRVMTDKPDMAGAKEQTLVYAFGPKSWRYMAQALDYSADGVAEFPANALDDAADAANTASPYAPPAAAPPPTQRRRNAAHAGLGKADPKLAPVKKATVPKRPAGKKRK